MESLEGHGLLSSPKRCTLLPLKQSLTVGSEETCSSLECGIWTPFNSLAAKMHCLNTPLVVQVRWDPPLFQSAAKGASPLAQSTTKQQGTCPTCNHTKAVTQALTDPWTSMCHSRGAVHRVTTRSYNQKWDFLHPNHSHSIPLLQTQVLL